MMIKKVVLSKTQHQDGIDALEMASQSMAQLAALLSAIENTNTLKQTKALAAMGCAYSDDLSHYFESTREDLEGGSLCN